MLCWRSLDLEKSGLEGLEEGWRITGEGLEQAAMLGYQIFVDGTELRPARGNFRAGIVNFLEIRKTKQVDQDGGHKGDSQTSLATGEMDCSLAPILVKFLRPEGVIMGADLRQYGPFSTGEVAPLPYVHARVFVANGAAEIFG